MTADQIKALVAILREDARCVDKHFNSRIGDRIENAADALEALTLENQRLRVDAERYRYLEGFVFADRRRRGPAYFGLPLPRPVSDPMQGSVAEHFGAAIDAARSQSEEKKP
jgi:hypothetical protein